MEPLRISSYTQSAPVPLTTAQRDGLSQILPSLQITPALGTHDSYVLTAGSVAGSITLCGLELVIAPRIAIDRVMYMLSWALGNARWQPESAATDVDTLVEAVVPLFVRLCEQATHRGLLHGYRRDEDALVTVRGRLRIDEQLRRHYGRTPPIEVAFDEYTADVLENRLLLSAARSLLKRNLRDASSVQKLHRLRSVLASVTPIEFTRHDVPTVPYTRLNAHYEPAVELARMILRSISPELGTRHRADGVLFDMNEVFESFVFEALRDRLGLDRVRFPKNCSKRPLHLDIARQVRIEPDLSWWEGTRCLFVGDVKFKRTESGKGKHADLYQLLAYSTATGLDDGMIIYAAGEAEPVSHVVRLAGQTLRVRVLNLSGSIVDLDLAVAGLASEISAMADRRQRLSIGNVSVHAHSGLL